MKDKPENKTATLHVLRPRSSVDALERINRMTGLNFQSLPESLIDEMDGKSLAEQDGEEMVYRALSLWATQEQEQEKND